MRLHLTSRHDVEQAIKCRESLRLQGSDRLGLLGPDCVDYCVVWDNISHRLAHMILIQKDGHLSRTCRAPRG